MCCTLYVAYTQQRGLLSCPAVRDRGWSSSPPVWLRCQDKSGPGIQSASHWDKWHSALITLSSLAISPQHNSYNFPVTSADGTQHSLFNSHSFQSGATGLSGDFFLGGNSFSGGSQYCRILRILQNICHTLPWLSLISREMLRESWF